MTDGEMENREIRSFTYAHTHARTQHAQKQIKREKLTPEIMHSIHPSRSGEGGTTLLPPEIIELLLRAVYTIKTRRRFSARILRPRNDDANLLLLFFLSSRRSLVAVVAVSVVVRDDDKTQIRNITPSLSFGDESLFFLSAFSSRARARLSIKKSRLEKKNNDLRALLLSPRTLTSHPTTTGPSRVAPRRLPRALPTTTLFPR